MKITEEEIEGERTDRGGWTKETLAKWGVTWPPPKGWKRALIEGRTIATAEAGVYRGLGGLFFNHETVNHSEGEYVRDGVTTNGVESVFAVMKRGLIGVYHHASKKHLPRYVDEFAFRLNDGRVQRHTLERLESFVSGTKGKRLTYKALIQ